jgi:hypothetical protein
LDIYCVEEDAITTSSFGTANVFSEKQPARAGMARIDSRRLAPADEAGVSQR